MFLFFFFNDTATTEIYTLSLHDALPIFVPERGDEGGERAAEPTILRLHGRRSSRAEGLDLHVKHISRERKGRKRDRKSTRLNSSHANISYAVFCLKKKKNNIITILNNYQ